MIDPETIETLLEIAIKEDGCHPYPLYDEDREALKNYQEQSIQAL